MKCKVMDGNFRRRLDQFLKSAFTDLPRAGMFTALRKGRVFVNGKRARDPGLNLSIGDEVEVREYKPGPQTGSAVMSVKQDLVVIHEDERILVLDKPRGVAMHPGKNVSTGTLLNGLTYYGNSRGFTPYLAHRLDRDTSGLLIVAKSQDTAKVLSGAFRRQEVKKEYMAVVLGSPPAKGVITVPIEGREARTEYAVAESVPWGGRGLSLLRVRTGTGRKHQIRRHLAGIGHPLAGDDQYGLWEANKDFSKEYRIKGFLLCCVKLEFRHPVQDKMCRFEVVLPDWFRRIFPGLPQGPGKSRQ